LSSVVAAEHHPSQKHLKRSVCLEQCAADIAAHCVPNHHFHQLSRDADPSLSAPEARGVRDDDHDHHVVDHDNDLTR
jgi:hypothetical protein